MQRQLKILIPKDAEISKSSVALDKLEFGGKKVLISKEELKKLCETYEKYIDKYGVDIGFVNYILNIR